VFTTLFSVPALKRPWTPRRPDHVHGMLEHACIFTERLAILNSKPLFRRRSDVMPGSSVGRCPTHDPQSDDEPITYCNSTS
jgi:hypothetical protein